MNENKETDNTRITTKSVHRDDLVTTANQLVSSIPVFGTFLSTPIVGAISYYQRKNLDDFMNKITSRFESIDISKIDKDFLNTEVFGNILLQILDAASRTSSELKQNALANIFLHSCTLPTSQHKGKQAFVRIIDQISDEEMIVLKVLYESTQNPEPLISLEEISSILGWDYIEIQVISGGLTQLGLAYDPTIGTWTYIQASFNESTTLSLSALGSRCIEYALQK